MCSGQLIDCISVPELYRRGVLLLLYNYKVKGVGPKPHVYGGVRIGLRSEGPHTEKVNRLYFGMEHIGREVGTFQVNHITLHACCF